VYILEDIHNFEIINIDFFPAMRENKRQIFDNMNWYLQSYALLSSLLLSIESMGITVCICGVTSCEVPFCLLYFLKFHPNAMITDS